MGNEGGRPGKGERRSGGPGWGRAGVEMGKEWWGAPGNGGERPRWGGAWQKTVMGNDCGGRGALGGPGGGRAGGDGEPGTENEDEDARGG